ncbi:restriction endonuclease subunit S [Methylobacterium ajmalii]|uniref:Restriction endonuclease subunit S n=1 Tax=Methylobacterium ajmalii TaxID=2738439 RepID=A0ABU9ZRN7_9HYPH
MIPTAALGDIVSIKGGGTPSKSKPEFWNGDIPWVSPKDMKSWEINGAEEKITEAAIVGSATNIVPSGSILIVNRSGILKHTLPVGIARLPVAINQDIKALICASDVHPEYVAHLVKAAEPVVLKWVRATTADNFPIENIRELQIPLPSLVEQKRIASILDDSVDVRRSRERSLELLDELKQSLFMQMFGDADHNHHSFPLVSIGSIIADGPSNGIYKPSSAYGRGVPILRINNFYDGEVTDLESLRRLEVDAHELDRFELKENDIVINRVNSREYVGKSAIVPCLKEKIVYESNMMRFSIIEEKASAHYVINALQTNSIKSQIRSKIKEAINQASINQSDVKCLEIPLPPLDEQRRLEKTLECLRSIRVVEKANVDRSEALAASLRQRAFDGRL